MLQRPLLISILAVSCSVFGDSTIAESAATSLASIEVFATRDQGSTRPEGLSSDRATVRVWVLDGIDRLETTLSHALPTDRQRAERDVLNRLRTLDEDWQRSANHSAQALLRAMELGLDRYPAVVFDESFVAYGLTDLGTATMHYRRWQARQP